MELRKEAYVFSADGQNVGHLDRVVIDPRLNEVTHIVVRQGVLFHTDKVVPISLVASGLEDRVTLREAARDLQSLPNFEETHYIPVNAEEATRLPLGQAPPLYWYPPVGIPYPAYHTEKTENIPPGTIALREGANVITTDGHSAGTIEQVLTDPLADRVTHFLISQGLLFPEKKLIPLTWVSEVKEQEVRLAVSKRTLEALEHYYVR